MAIKAFSEIKESNMASTLLFYTLFYYILLFWGGSVAEQLERWTCNSEASSWSPALTALAEYCGGGGGGGGGRSSSSYISSSNMQ